MRLTGSERKTTSSAIYLTLDWVAIGEVVRERALEALAGHFTALRIAESSSDGPVLRFHAWDKK